MKFSQAISRVKWLIARENFIILSRRESIKSHFKYLLHFPSEKRPVFPQ